MTYLIEFKTSAQKELSKLHVTDYEKLVKTIFKLSEDPRPTGCKKLQGAKHLYRIRVGNFRVIYEIKDAVLTIVIIKVGDRKNIYK